MSDRAGMEPWKVSPGKHSVNKRTRRIEGRSRERDILPLRLKQDTQNSNSKKIQNESKKRERGEADTAPTRGAEAVGLFLPVTHLPTSFFFWLKQHV